MKRRWMIPLMLVLAAGIAGFGLTREKAQEVQKINAGSGEVRNIGSRARELNPLREDAYQGLSETVKEYYEKAGSDKEGFVEAYDNIQVYTKLGEYTGTYVAFVRYDMKIKDIYTKVPGLETLYIKKNGTGSEYEVKKGSETEGLAEYVALLGSHDDVKALFEDTNTAYETAVNSDALLREALLDLKNAYEG